MTPVSKEAFFEVINELNVTPNSDRMKTRWETPRRELIGVSTPGYMCEGDGSYSLRDDLIFPTKGTKP
jgi:hypothetical protein